MQTTLYTLRNVLVNYNIHSPPDSNRIPSYVFLTPYDSDPKEEGIK